MDFWWLILQNLQGYDKERAKGSTLGSSVVVIY